MPTSFYSARYRLDDEDRYIIWHSNGSDGVLVNQTGFVTTFVSQKTLHSYANQLDIRLVDEAPILHDFDVVQDWLNNQTKRIDQYDQFLNAWNLFSDVARSTAIDFLGDSSDHLTIYNKLFYASDAANFVLKPSNAPAFIPTWTSPEIRALAHCLQNGLSLFRSKTRACEPAQEWRATFGNVMPLGHLCRAAFPERWLRIHSLPSAKRYPDSDAERATILVRHNAVATFVLGEASHCILFITRFGDSTSWNASGDLSLPVIPQHAMTTIEDDSQTQYFAAPVVWRSGAFDDLILACADERSGPLLFVNLATEQAYAPYDGGADLFVASNNLIVDVRPRFADWLSKREDGL